MASIIKITLPILAVAGCGLAFIAVREGLRTSPAQPPILNPASNPYEHSVSGAGIVEARSENIAVAPALGGIVKEVFVKWGQSVHAGDKLFQIDPGPMVSQVAVQEAQVAVQRALVLEAESNLTKLKAQPRPEDVAIYRAKYDQTLAQLALAQDQYDRIFKVSVGAMSEDDLNVRKFSLAQAKAATAAAKADLDKTLAGTWDKDIKIAEATLQTAKANLLGAESRMEPLKIDLERLTVSAPVDGTVLRINIRRGEYAAAAGVGAGSASDGAVVLGDIQHLHVRVDIDENDVPRVVPGSEAIGFVRGQTDLPIHMKFVRIEPFVIPKKNLTGASGERVDTRVLQIIYAVDNPKLTLYVGQQLDVFVQASPQAIVPTP